MQIKSLFEKDEKDIIIERLNKLTANSQRLWGKMTVGQMLAHCKGPLRVALSDKALPRPLIGRLLGWTVKKKLYDETPWKPGLPTAPSFVVKDERDFEKEKTALLQLLEEFYRRGPSGTGRFPHPFFGSFTPEQWGKSLWKHIDHHLRQFGV